MLTPKVEGRSHVCSLHVDLTACSYDCPALHDIYQPSTNSPPKPYCKKDI